MTFVSMLGKLTPTPKSWKPQFADGNFAHAAVLQALTAVNPDLAHELHDRQPYKDFSVALVPEQDSLYLRLSFISDNAVTHAQTLAQSLMAHNSLRLGKTICNIENFVLPDISNWHNLLNLPRGHLFNFQFVTPTVITKKRPDGKRYCVLFPEPRDVFMSLARRWRDLNGPPLPTDLEEFLTAGWCTVKAHHALRSVYFKTTERGQVGFVGQVTYECAPTASPTHWQALAGLTHLARFTGVGYQTARGMGCVDTRVKEENL